MSQKKLYQITKWTEILKKEMGHLSKKEQEVLGLWSFGVGLTRNSSLTINSIVLSEFLGKKEETMRQRLREFYKEAEKKRGKKRRELIVEESFPALLRWIMKHWTSNQLPIAMDASTLGDKLTILSVSVLYRSCAIPVAWKILKGNKPRAWNPEWFRMLSSLKNEVDPSIQVLVLTDRGLFSGLLFKHIRQIGWHPFMRLKINGTFRPENKSKFYTLDKFITDKGTFSQLEGTLFRTNPIKCTLFTFYGEDSKEPWLIVTDIPAKQADPCWYSLRFWIEQSFRTIKRGGLQWQNTRMTDPDRVQRMWLVFAVSFIYLLLFGTQKDTFDHPHEITLYTRSKRRTSVFRKGWFSLLLAFFFDSFPKIGDFVPEKLPTHNLTPFNFSIEGRL